jgi:integrase
VGQKYRVKTVVLSNGERLPMLVDACGQPVFEPTVYSLTELRVRNRATNTIDNTLRALLVFCLFLDLRKIDLKKRLEAAQLLSLGEVEDLVRLCRLPVERLTLMLDDTRTTLPVAPAVSLEKHRRRLRAESPTEIVPASAATRLRDIRNYVGWLVANRSSRPGADDAYRSALESAREFVVGAIEARLPSGDSRGSLGHREGLDPEVVARMLQVIDPRSTENPWRDQHSQYRNALIIRWLYWLGLRRGELLGIRVSDIDFRKATVVVARRADDPSDPRRYQPTVKTRAREIPLSPGLLDETYAYVMNHRAVQPGARKHDFLFVSEDNGAPLSISSLTKIFLILRTKCPDLPRDLSAHVLRHTWNDRYSETMDKRQVAEESEKKMRSYLMGWSETSGTAAIYTRRHIRKRAQEASLAMQERLFRQEKERE